MKLGKRKTSSHAMAHVQGNKNLKKWNYPLRKGLSCNVLFPLKSTPFLFSPWFLADCQAYKDDFFYTIRQLKFHMFFKNRMLKWRWVQSDYPSIRSCKFSSSTKSRNQTSHSNHLRPASSSSCNDCASYSSSNATIHLYENKLSLTCKFPSSMWSWKQIQKLTKKWVNIPCEQIHQINLRRSACICLSWQSKYKYTWTLHVSCSNTLEAQLLWYLHVTGQLKIQSKK